MGFIVLADTQPITAPQLSCTSRVCLLLHQLLPPLARVSQAPAAKFSMFCTETLLYRLAHGWRRSPTACASAHSGKSGGIVFSKLVNFGAIGNLIAVGGGSGTGKIILLTPQRGVLEVLGRCLLALPVAVTIAILAEAVFSPSQS